MHRNGPGVGRSHRVAEGVRPGSRKLALDKQYRIFASLCVTYAGIISAPLIGIALTESYLHATCCAVAQNRQGDGVSRLVQQQQLA